MRQPTVAYVLFPVPAGTASPRLPCRMKWWHPAWVLLTAWGAEPGRQRGQRRVPDAEAAKHQKQLAYAHMWMLSGVGVLPSFALFLLVQEPPTWALVVFALLPVIWPCAFGALLLLGLGRRPPAEMRDRAAAASVLGVLGGLIVALLTVSLP